MSRVGQHNLNGSLQCYGYCGYKSFCMCHMKKELCVPPTAFHMSTLEMLSYTHILFQGAENIITPFLQSEKHKEALFKVKVSQQRAEDEIKLLLCFNNLD